MNIKSKFFINKIVKNIAITAIIITHITSSYAKDLNPTSNKNFFDIIAEKGYKVVDIMDNAKVEAHVVKRHILYHSKKAIKDINALGLNTKDILTLSRYVLKQFGRTPVGKTTALGLGASALKLAWTNREKIKDGFNNISDNTEARIDNLLNNVLKGTKKIIVKKEARKFIKLKKNSIKTVIENLNDMIQKHQISREKAEEIVKDIEKSEINTLDAVLKDIIQMNDANITPGDAGLDKVSTEIQSEVGNFINTLRFGNKELSEEF